MSAAASATSALARPRRSAGGCRKTFSRAGTCTIALRGPSRSLIRAHAGFHEERASPTSGPDDVPDSFPGPGRSGSDFLTGGGGDDGLLSQAETVVKGNTAAVLERALNPDMGGSDLDYLQELIAIQSGGPKNIGFFGTRNMGFLHQQLVEILSYALVLTENHIYTSGATGTNAAVIRGALRAEKPDLLTVLLPQSLSKQPEESQELLEKVREGGSEVIFNEDNDHLPLGEASRICNDDILTRVQQVICFAFHDSNLLLDTCREAKMARKIVTLFYLD